MALERALKAIRLEPTDRIPHWEFISHPEFERSVTGIDPYQHPQRSAVRLAEALDLDLVYVPLTDDSLPPVPESGVDGQGHRVVRWGASTTWRWDWGDRFKTEEDVLVYQPLEHLDLSSTAFPEADDYSVSVEELAARFRKRFEDNQAVLGQRALTGVSAWYNTFFMWPLLTFGWELFLVTAMAHPQEMARLMDDFGQISLKVLTAWSYSGTPLMVCHDDICYAKGPVFSPRWLRQNVYPWYERLWEPLHQRGVKVLFMSDGNVDDVVDDVFACGADGIMGEPYTDLEAIARRYPDKIILGNVDNRVLVHGTREDIYAEVERCTRFGLACPGYFYSVTNHIPYDLPIDAVRYYFEACERLGRRTS
jgi:hypothetical protein